ncbi:hypothetical protein [Streptomyces gilvus]|uniref:hypothetical protein n=1 Tax=Streptomyces gilvus TaxID=2920937 RepID=UPI001F0FEF29|nr:hypothetical protein [Streptomyces sp. CME 23]MCH5672421.1 hypothetical protein [Streptomyces sp. CME 23]
MGAAGLTVRAASCAQGFDWTERSTWAETLRGADAAYLVCPTDVGAPEAARNVGLFAHEAVGLGVRRLVLLSARGEERARPTEEALRAARRELSYRAVPAREYGARLAGFGVAPEEVAFLVELFESLLDGRNAYLSDGVRRVLGREPRDFADFAGKAAMAGAWKG